MEDLCKETGAVQNVDLWESAYAEQMHDAALGKLFRGIVHNLNGLLQAFSMQAELLELMFQQAEQFFGQIFHGTEIEKQEALLKLNRLLGQRGVLADQLNEKVLNAQKIVQRTLSLRAHPATSSETGYYPLNDLIREEVDFLCADSFFKHKVTKEIELEEPLPVPQSDLFGLRLAIQAVLHNALESLLAHKTENPILRVTALKSGENISLEITDNGLGFSDELQQKMFSPFFSTKEDHAGLGLYLARKSLKLLGGEISAFSKNGRTSFVLQFCSTRDDLQQ